MLLAACGGGSDGTISTQAQAQRDQTAAIVQAQQSVSARIAAAVQPGSATENFEAGMGDWQNWGNAQVVAGAGVSDSSALQVGPAAGGAALQVPGIVDGTTYRLTAQVRVTDPVGGPATLGVDFYNASGVRIIGTRALPNVTNTSFAPFSYDVQAPVGTAYALVWVWKDGSTGFAYVDDVAFGAASAPPPPPPPSDSNLVSNGGFEAGMTGWTDWGNTHVVTGQANSGTSALGVGAAAGGAGYNVDGVVPGTTYRLGVSAKVSDASETVYVGVNFVDAAGSLLANTQRSTTSTDYTTLGADIIAPTGATRAVVYVWKNAGSGLAYVDDFNFGVTSGSEPPLSQVSPNLLNNGDFDAGFSGWMNWGNIEISGSRATVAQVGTGAGGFGQNVAGILPGKTYRLSASVSVSAAGETGYLGLKFVDAAGNVLQDQIVPFTSTSASTAQVQLVAPASASSALVYVWKNAGSGLALVDNVLFVQLGFAPPPPPEVQLSGSAQQRLDTDGYRTHGDQSISRLSNGTYVAAWLAFGDPSAASTAPLVCFQRLDANLSPLGSNACMPDAQATDLPTWVLPRPGGGFVLAWTIEAGQSGNSIIYGQRSRAFDAAGNALGPAQDGVQQPVPASAAALTGGGYVDLVTRVVANAPADASNISFQRYSADGTPIGSPTSVGDQGGLGNARVVPLAGGGFAVAWQNTGTGDPLYTRMFTADGTPVGEPVLAWGVTPFCDNPPNCTFQDLRGLSPMDDGGYLVVWRNGFGIGGGTVGMFARRVGPDGSPGAAMATLSDSFLDGGVAPAGPDGFVLVWQASVGSAGQSQTSMRRYDATPLR